MSFSPVPCIGCCICHSHCPMGIPIGTYFEMYNTIACHPEELGRLQPEYRAISDRRAPASDCVTCHACESVCPQHIPIAKWIAKVTEEFES